MKTLEGFFWKGNFGKSVRYAPQNGVRQPGEAGMAALLRQVDGSMDEGRGRNLPAEQGLKHSHAQECAHWGGKLFQRLPEYSPEHVVAQDFVANRSVHKLGEKTSAPVAQVFAPKGAVEGDIQEKPVFKDAQEHINSGIANGVNGHGLQILESFANLDGMASEVIRYGHCTFARGLKHEDGQSVFARGYDDTVLFHADDGAGGCVIGGIHGFRGMDAADLAFVQAMGHGPGNRGTHQVVYLVGGALPADSAVRLLKHPAIYGL
jgi:hypothetical protein